MEAEETKYHLLYRLRPFPEGLTKSEFPWDEEDTGACDAVLVGSVIYPPDGGLSVMFYGVDGRTKEPMDIQEMFKLWTILTHKLGEELPEGGRKQFCASTFETFRKAFMESRGPG